VAADERAAAGRWADSPSSAGVANDGICSCDEAASRGRLAAAAVRFA
jgi:hypothetical protein